ncbi:MULTISPECIES: helix-turn-helix domain-containing protein [Planococcus]|uniref:Transcriptional regulator n=1 Tax=Planococcus maitriensis TaxID=221799 RepID=A0A365K8U3_9BACL|nr:MULTISPECIES: helix-turn-helix domain-containing protein [Planococcus]AUD15049.1 transcriptional regulator [Planococcus sp. MB-3u-03]PKG47011.1 transcriptional regulator [Planococcus sp. Urea-trap-24]PKG87860.1 transcriptional regulator [Planococcus sp. Urea-3u-39]PKH35518.1 transcriptional regulator [Planococcus sp. MB-3u-09]RAZ69104.1 transcriptional regulator [Planococcus maitriensis]
MEFDLFKNQVRFKIALELIDVDEGLSILQLNKLLKEVSQATLYRHVNSMVEDDLLKVVGINRSGKVEEKLYALNTQAYKVSQEDWQSATYSERIRFITYYFMYILQNYKNYHERSVEEQSQDQSTFSLVKLNLTDDRFNDFQSELGSLMEKYYNAQEPEQGTERAVSLVIIP